MVFFKFSVLFTFLCVLTYSLGQVCTGINEEFRNSGQNRITCINAACVRYAIQTVPACYCKEGFMRLYDSTSPCVNPCPVMSHSCAANQG